MQMRVLANYLKRKCEEIKDRWLKKRKPDKWLDKHKYIIGQDGVVLKYLQQMVWSIKPHREYHELTGRSKHFKTMRSLWIRQAEDYRVATEEEIIAAEAKEALAP